MRKKTVSVIMLSLLTMLTLMSCISRNALAQTSVLIGWAHPLSGPVAGTAAVHHLYYQMVIDDYNAKGGLDVPGVGLLPIETIVYDDEYDPTKSIDLITRLITVDQVDLLFAPWSTAFNVAAMPLFKSYHYPVVGLTVGSNTLSDMLMADPEPYFFLTLAQPREDAEELVELITYINTHYPAYAISKVGFAFRADEHGMEHAEAIRDGLTDMGIAVPVYESYAVFPPPADWTPIISMFRDAGVDATINCGYDENALFVRQCIDQNYNPKLMVIGPALETPFLVYEVFKFTPGEFACIAYYNGFPATTYSTPELQEWVNYHVEYTKAKAGFGYKPFPASGVFYAGVECLFKAVETPGIGLDREKIRDALETTVFDTLVGTFQFKKGLGPIVANHGTITQWQGKEMMDVIWPGQNLPNSPPYVPPASAQLIYPKYPWSWAYVPDINRDAMVDIKDVAISCLAFGSWRGPPPHPRWNFVGDWNGDDIVDMKDIVTIARSFGTKLGPPWTT